MFTRYDVKIFRSRSKETETCHRGRNYVQRKNILQKTNTWRNSVCHDDRHFGAYYALMHNVGREETRGLGHWGDDVMDTHYAKIFSPDTVARMGGFADAKHYYLQRGQLDPFKVGDVGICMMAGSVFPQLDDPNFTNAIEQVSEQVSRCIVELKSVYIVYLLFLSKCAFVLSLLFPDN